MWRAPGGPPPTGRSGAARETIVSGGQSNDGGRTARASRLPELSPARSTTSRNGCDPDDLVRRLRIGTLFVVELQQPLVFAFVESDGGSPRRVSSAVVAEPTPSRGVDGEGSARRLTRSSVDVRTDDDGDDDERAVVRRANGAGFGASAERSAFRLNGAGRRPPGYGYFSLKPAMAALYAAPALSTVEEYSETATGGAPSPPDGPLPAERGGSPTGDEAPEDERASPGGGPNDVPSTSAASTARRQHKLGQCVDVEEVRVLTSRLNLVTRRPSVQAWRQENLVGDRPHFMARLGRADGRTDDDDDDGDDDGDDGDDVTEWSPEVRDRISASLDWLKTELTNMKQEDAILARRLLNIRKEMCRLKLSRCTERHRMILDEAIEIEEERDELERSRDCDLTPEPFSPTLKQYGVTRMNIHSRRFSVF